MLVKGKQMSTRSIPAAYSVCVCVGGAYQSQGELTIVKDLCERMPPSFPLSFCMKSTKILL